MSGDEEHTWVESSIDGELPPPERYAVQKRIGEGATGLVDAVHDRRLKRVVARKVLRSDAQRGNFLREAQITAALQHPAIVPIYDAQEDEDGLWYTMRRIQGDPLDVVLRGQESRLRFVDAFLRVCEAMAFAHENGVMHRDLKPANIMLGNFGEVFLVDFGLAVRLSQSRGGRIVGTPLYMSPEAARGEAATPASDVWSLGAILHEILVGHPPFRGEVQDVLERLRTCADVKIDAPDAPEELVAIAQKALRQDPQSRYPNAGAMREDVADFTAGRLVGAHTYTPAALVRHYLLRYRGYALLAAVALGMLTLVVGAAWWSTAQERNRAVRAEAARGLELAAVLEERARSLSTRPEAKVAARQALKLDPSRIWARGVLAEPSGSRIPVLSHTFDVAGCRDGHQLDRWMVLVCEGETRLVDPRSGEVRDTLPWHAVLYGGDAVYFISPEGLLRGTVEAGRWAVRTIPMSTAGQLVVFPTADPYCVRYGKDRVPVGGTCGTELGPIDAELTGEQVYMTMHADGTSLLWDNISVQVCEPQMTSCLPVPLAGILQLALWDRTERRALLMTSSGEAVVYHHPTRSLRTVDRAEAGGVHQLIHVGDLVASLEQGSWIALYDRAAAPVGQIEVGRGGPIRVTSFDGELWVMREGGVDVYTIPVAARHDVVRLANGVGALDAADGRVVFTVTDEVFELRTDGAHRLWKAPGFLKSLRLDGDSLWVGTYNDGVFELKGGKATATALPGAKRLGLGPDGPLALHHHIVQGTTLGSVGDLGVARGRVIHESPRGTVKVSELDGTVLFERQSSGEVWALALSPDGTQAAYALADNHVHWVDLETGADRVLDGRHDWFVAKLGFSPSGDRLASGSWDGTSRVWNQGELEVALEAHEGRVTQVVFTTEDELITGSWDGTLQRWDLTAWADAVSR